MLDLDDDLGSRRQETRYNHEEGQCAVRSGEEKLTTELLDRVKIDAASEKACQELKLAINTGKIRSAPKRDDGPRSEAATQNPSTVKPWTPGSKRSATW
jgi:hypothetical protein